MLYIINFPCKWGFQISYFFFKFLSLCISRSAIIIHFINICLYKKILFGALLYHSHIWTDRMIFTLYQAVTLRKKNHQNPLVPLTVNQTLTYGPKTKLGGK